jgi:PKD repeat protein
MARSGRTGGAIRADVVTLSDLARRKAGRLLERIWQPGKDGKAGGIVERLEIRRLLSGTVSLNGSTLVIVGSGDPNTISVDLQNNSMVATVDGSSQSFAASSVNEIQVYGGNGGDTVSIDPNISVAQEIYGGSGNDSITVGGGDATVNGGSGNDTIIGTDGTDTFHGGSGNDSLVGGTGPATLYGDAGNDTIIGQSGEDTISGGTGTNVTSGPSTDTIINNTNSQAPPSPTAVQSLHAAIQLDSPQSIFNNMAIQVDGLESGLGAGTPMTADYQWDFGDPGSEYNTLTGFSAAHIYANPGVYNISLTVTNQNGQSSTATQQVYVFAKAWLRKIYVAPWGNDANNGATPNDPVQSVDRANALIGDGTMVLFADGATYDVDGNININGYDDVEIGSWGSGSPPVLMYDGTPQGYDQIINFQIGSTNFAVDNITFDSIYTDGNGEPEALRMQGTNLTVDDCTFLNLNDAMDMALGPTGVLVQDCTAPDPQALLAYFGYVAGNNIVFLGNTVANSVNEHVIRVDGANDVLIDDNTLSNISGSKTSLNIQYGQYIYIAGNTLHGPVSMGPLATTQPGSLANFDGQLDYAVFEDNTLADGSFLFQPGSFDVTARNNVIDATDTHAFYIEPYDELYGRTVIGAEMLGNTVYNYGTMGNFLVDSDGQSQGTVMVDNLYVAPELQAITYRASSLYITGDDLGDFSLISHNIWADAPTSWGGYNYVNASWYNPSSYLTAAQWNALPQVDDDLFSSVTIDPSTYAITGSPPASTYGIAYPGLFADFYGNARPTSDLSAGAVQS